MTKFLIAALSASAILAPSAALAQARGGIVVVDTDRILSECTACRAATATLNSQTTTLRTRAQTLQTQLQTEGQPIQTAVNALNGKQPDAALQARITAFQTKQRNAEQELATGQRNLQSTQAHVSQQLSTRLLPIIEQSRARRGAAIAVAKSGLLASDTAVDITGEVLTALNQQVPAVSVTPLPQQPQSTTPGR